VNPDAIAPLLAMQTDTTIHDAHGHAVDAVKAGATSEQVRQAITEWMSLQAAQVQQLFAGPQRRDCCAGVEREHPQTADIQDYLRQKGEL
jgi:hypothetical protein